MILFLSISRLHLIQRKKTTNTLLVFQAPHRIVFRVKWFVVTFSIQTKYKGKIYTMYSYSYETYSIMPKFIIDNLACIISKLVVMNFGINILMVYKNFSFPPIQAISLTCMYTWLIRLCVYKHFKICIEMIFF